MSAILDQARRFPEDDSIVFTYFRETNCPIQTVLESLYQASQTNDMEAYQRWYRKPEFLLLDLQEEWWAS
jgi:hypothetical protein